MEDEVAMREIRSCRGRRTRSFLQEIDVNRLWREACAAHAEAKLLARVMKPKPFKIIGEVID